MLAKVEIKQREAEPVCFTITSVTVCRNHIASLCKFISRAVVRFYDRREHVSNRSVASCRSSEIPGVALIVLRINGVKRRSNKSIYFSKTDTESIHKSRCSPFHETRTSFIVSFDECNLLIARFIKDTFCLSVEK